ncbi:MAG: hypothetical protein Q8933_13360 [Bacteroidota bacterium]|nr:hypothetical protein [Bacteroidota bacterium]MDP4196289.1 hypothetical protein [Bacteroidota bacterium]
MKYIFISILFLFSTIYCQSTTNHLFVPSGYIIETLSGYGYSKSITNQSNIASSNPSAMDRFINPTIGISYQIESDLKPGYIADIGVTRYKKSLPQSAGLILPYKGLRLGFGFSQKYNCSLVFGKILVTTVDNPDGIGNASLNVAEEAEAIRYSGLISYGFNDLIYKNDRFILGGAVNYDRLNYHYSWGLNETDPDRVLKSHGSNVSYSFGIMYAFPNSTRQKNLFSISFERGAEFNNMETDENLARGIYQSSYLYSSKDISISKEPDKGSLGIDYFFSDLSLISTTVSYIGWSSAGNNKEDQIEAASSYIYKLRDNLSSSVGIFYTDLNYKDNTFAKDGSYRSLFIMAGAVYSYALVDFDLVIADSHLLSGKLRKETIGKLSVGFHL